MSVFETVTPEEVPDGAIIIDVREDDEWVAGHAAGARHLPMSQLPDRLEEIDPDADNYIICRSGGRSQKVCQWLTAQGYTAFNVAGGTGAWLEAGLPMQGENGGEPVVK